MRKTSKQSFAPTAGLDYRIPTTMLTERHSSGMKNMRLTGGVIRKDFGYSAYGSNQPLLGVPCGISVYRQYDGDLNPFCFTTKYIYAYETASDRWNPVGMRNVVIHTCETAWTANGGSITVSTDPDEKRGTYSVKMVKVPDPVLLVHFNGADGQTTYTAETGQTVTFAGDAQLDTAQKKFDSASLLLDGTDDYVTVPDSTDWAMGTGDFTADAWVRFAALPAASGYQAVFYQFEDADNRWGLRLYNNAGTYQWQLFVHSGGADTLTMTKDSPGLLVDTWYHVAVTRSGTSFRIFQDGTICGTATTSTVSIPDMAGALYIGYRGDTWAFNGWIDELRIEKGTARWTANFTAPTGEHYLLSTGNAMYSNVSDLDIHTESYLHFWIKSVQATAAGDLQIAVSEQNAGAEGATYARYNIPALVANTWTEVELATATPTDKSAGTFPDDLNAVKSVYLYIVTDVGNRTVYIDDVRSFIRGTGDQDDGWNACMHNNEYFATNGKDRILRKQQESDFDHMAGITDFAKDIQSFKTRLVLLNTNESANPVPQRVRWTIAGALAYAATDWTGTGSGFVDLIDTPGHIVKSKFLGDTLAIYKEDAIYSMTWIGGASIFRFDQVVSGLGLIGQRAVVKRKGVHYFVGTDYNIYEYTGLKQPESIGDQVASQIATLINPEQEDRTVMFYDDDEDELTVYFPINLEEQPSRGYRYSFKENAWSATYRPFCCMGTHQEYSTLTFGTYGGTFGQSIQKFGETSSKSAAKVFLGATYDGYVYKVNKATTNLNSVAQECWFDTVDLTLTGTKDAEDTTTTKNLGVEYIDTDKRILHIHVEAYGNDVIVQYSTDDGVSWNGISGSGTHVLTTSWVKYTSDLDVSVQKVRFRFYNNTLSSDLRIRWFKTDYIVTGGGIE